MKNKKAPVAGQGARETLVSGEARQKRERTTSCRPRGTVVGVSVFTLRATRDQFKRSTSLWAWHTGHLLGLSRGPAAADFSTWKGGSVRWSPLSALEVS